MDPVFGRPASIPVAVGIAIAVSVALVAGCTTSSWDTSEINRVQNTDPPKFSRDEAGLVASLTYHLSNVGDDLNEWSPPKDEAECAATRIVRRLTVERLLGLGYDPDQGNLSQAYTTDERTALTNILTNCIDFEQGLLSVISSYDKLTINATACFARGMRRLGLVRDLAGGLLDGRTPDPFDGAGNLSKGMGQLMAQCFQAEDLPTLQAVDPFPQDRDNPDGSSTTTPSGSSEPSTTTTTQSAGG